MYIFSIKNLVIIPILFLSGCANLTSPARNHEIESSKAYWLDYDASRRGALIIPEGKKIHTCAEPAPDVALSLVSKLETSLKDKSGLDATAKAEFNASVVELGKRTQMVMFLREALFRLCEQSLNNDLDKKEILDIYTQILKTATEIVQSDKTAADAKLKEAKNQELLILQNKLNH